MGVLFAILAAWAVLSIVVAVGIGRAARVRDAQVPAVPAAELGRAA